MAAVPPLAASVGVVGAAAGFGAWHSRAGARSAWYRCARPPSAPPGPVFGLVWAVLYPLLAYALYRSLAGGDDRRSTAAQCAQLIAGAWWCRAYFVGRQPALSVALLAAVVAGAAATAALTRDAVVRAVYLGAYLPWVSFALWMTASTRFAACAGL